MSLKYPEIMELISKEVDAISLKPGVKSLNKSLSSKECMAKLIYKMIEFESGYDTNSKYKESFKDAKGKNVISRGLLQLSIESVNQSAYGCKIKDAKELHDPATNIKCGVKILSYWANRDLVLMGEPKKGGARYWSVCRASSKSNAKILEYLK